MNSSWQPVGLEESQRKSDWLRASDWVRADFADFEGQIVILLIEKAAKYEPARRFALLQPISFKSDRLRGCIYDQAPLSKRLK